MLVNVHVKNLALIEEADISFSEGLNILTGETGAGKSIIIGSINYCLGEKVSADVIREGADYALVELVFQVSNPNTISIIHEMDLPIEDDGTLILTRKIQKQRSVLKVCGESVTAKQMKNLASLLIDIHGQHEHQSLLSEKNQAIILDEFAGAELNIIKNQIAGLYKEYISLIEEKNRLSMDDMQREREISLAKFEIDEIENADLKIDEEDELNKKYKLMQNSKKIVEALAIVSELINGSSDSAIDQVGRASKELSYISSLDTEISSIYSRLLDVEQNISDISRDIVSNLEKLDFSEEDFALTEERLNTINHLTMKYGGSIERILAYCEERRNQLEKLLDVSGAISRINDNISDKEKQIIALCEKAHKIRVRVAKTLSIEISKVLEELNFLKVNFEIQININDKFRSDGYDDITFMISLNPGEKIRPISDVASGGELSRIMLALKTVFASNDHIESLIFDEIDTGISGKTAWKVSERMGSISSEHQIICITHLPQIAAMADSHYLIEKNERDGKTVTTINYIDDANRIDEIARMLGSDNITEAVRANAIELINNAKEVKQNRR